MSFIVSKLELILNKKGDALLVKNINFKRFGTSIVFHTLFNDALYRALTPYLKFCLCVWISVPSVFGLKM